jgi:hypothetical protein
LFFRLHPHCFLPKQKQFYSRRPGTGRFLPGLALELRNRIGSILPCFLEEGWAFVGLAWRVLSVAGGFIF